MGNGIEYPDIALLPNIAVFFGITIDELFQLPNEAEFERIENMFWHERQISAETFSHCVRFLEGIVQNNPKNIRALVCLARLYNHRAKADHETASGYAKTVLLLNPDEKAGWTAFLRVKLFLILNGFARRQIRISMRFIWGT